MADFAFGTIFKLGSTTVGNLNSVSGPEFSADTIDVTTHDSEDAYREFIQGLRDGGEISVEGDLTTTNSSDVLEQFNTTSVVTATIDLPTTPSVSRFTASVICTAFSTEAPIDDRIPFSSTFKVSGKPELGQID